MKLLVKTRRSDIKRPRTRSRFAALFGGLGRPWSDRRVFLPGQYDAPDKLLLPDRLYGREAETDVLTSAFERVVTKVRPAGLVSGHSGIGKSSWCRNCAGECYRHVVSSPLENLTSTSKTSLCNSRASVQDLVRDVLGRAMPKSSLCGGSCCRPWAQRPIDDRADS